MNNEINFDELDFNEYTISQENCNIRLDKYLSTCLPELSRSYIQDLIKEGYVFVNEVKEKSSYKLEENDHIIIYFKPIEELTVEPAGLLIIAIYLSS